MVAVGRDTRRGNRDQILREGDASATRDRRRRLRRRRQSKSRLRVGSQASFRSVTHFASLVTLRTAGSGDDVESADCCNPCSA